MKQPVTPWYAPPAQWMEAPWHGRKWREAMAADSPYPADRFSGRGIVFSTGGETHFTNLWVNLCLLRRIHQCTLPVEVWHFGDSELNAPMAALLQEFDVRIVNGEALADDLPGDRWRGFALKSLAIIHSGFQEVLFLDTDSHPVRDPSFLFEERAYRWAGSCFWPDIWRTGPDSKIWEALDLHFVDEDEWETGQLVIDKSRCWRALNLVEHLNRHFTYYYQHVYGDKMTFYAAWKKLDQPYAMTPRSTRLSATPSSRMLLNQHDFEGELLFQHRTGCEWSLEEGAERGSDSVHQEACEKFLDELREKWPPGERTCAPALQGKRMHTSPPVAQRLLAAILPKAVAGKRQPARTLPVNTTATPWERMARQIVHSPRLATPRLMGTAIEGLQESDEKTGRAIFGFFAACIFVDPRLAEMMPERLDIEGTPLQDEWAILAEFTKQARGLPGITGLLPVHGNSPFPNPTARLTPREKMLADWLEEILHGVWKVKGASSDGSAAPSRAITKPWRVKRRAETVLVLTPLKNAADLAEGYCERLARLSYPPELLSMGLLESDSTDGTHEVFDKALDLLRPRWKSTGLWKQDYHYTIPEGMHRWHSTIQLKRREILALGRNELLLRALKDEDWVLWLDADVMEYPRDIIEQLLSHGKEILQPHCVQDYGGHTFDQNAWRDRNRLHMDALRGREILSPLDAVGGTMLLIR
ncbi:MAG: hypothetical protein WCD79_00670, partial [Chthoniobacteraceae bacterium]